MFASNNLVIQTNHDVYNEFEILHELRMYAFTESPHPMDGKFTNEAKE